MFPIKIDGLSAFIYFLNNAGISIEMYARNTQMRCEDVPLNALHIKRNNNIMTLKANKMHLLR